MKYYCEDSQQVLQELNSQKSGLTEKEAAERLLQNGANELKAVSYTHLLPDHLPLSNMEICTLVSNAWENAFDATENVPVGRRMVEVRIQEFQEQLVISIDNSCNNDIVIIDNLPQASRTGHGYGTKSIQSIDVYKRQVYA